MTEDMLRPPVNRAMRTLDRAFFKKSLPLSAARIADNKQIFPVRSELAKSKDIISLERMSPVVSDPEADLAEQGRKCLLLNPAIKHDDTTTWSPTIHALLSKSLISVIPYTLNLTYDYWDYHDIVSSILPQDELDEVPSGFSIVGHVAHLNLRAQYLPYKSLIADVLLDKNPTVKTVINKIDDVGTESVYRTFQYEVLAGPDDLNVEVKEEDCVFAFDYSQVYWNPRLHGEHRRLVSTFQPGDTVCDVMAGVGPFAVPAGRRKVFVWANDLNPASHAALVAAVKKNKVDAFVRPSNDDGRAYIRSAAKALYHAKTQHAVPVYSKQKRTDKAPPQVVSTYTQKRTFDHFIMNLPASAMTFLPSFIGLYSLADIPPGQQLPVIHVYCFSTKSDDNVAEGVKICEEISRQLQFEMGVGKVEEGGVKVTDVRDVAPNKRMFCASFRLPAEVAWRKVEES